MKRNSKLVLHPSRLSTLATKAALGWMSLLLGFLLLLAGTAWAIAAPDTAEEKGTISSIQTLAQGNVMSGVCDPGQKRIAPGRVIIKASPEDFAELENAFQTEPNEMHPSGRDYKKTFSKRVVDALRPYVGKEGAGRPRVKRIFREMAGIMGRPGMYGESFERYGLMEVPELTEDADEARELTRAVVNDLIRSGIEAYPDFEISVTEYNDPYFPSSAGAWGQAFFDLWGLDKLQCDEAHAWTLSQGEGIVVAVIDTGIDYNHPDLTGNVWFNPDETSDNGVDDDHNGFVDDAIGWDFFNNDSDPFDDYGHGTHVAGTIAAAANNGIGMAGVAPRVHIMSVKVLDSSGSGYFSDVAEGICYAADNGAKVINISLGGSLPIDQVPAYLSDALEYAHSKDVVTVAAAGNSSARVEGFSPASDPHVIAVSAFDHLDQKASFSNYGTGISVAAPGGGDKDPTGIYDPFRSILSLLSSQASSSMTGSGNLIVGGQYLRQAGTSMAAPHVAGAAALVRALHPDYTAERVRQAIQNGSDLHTGFDEKRGYGRVNAYGALGESGALAALILGPLGTVEGDLPTPVTGIVEGPGLASWTLDYGTRVSAQPTTWTSLASGTAAIHAGQLGALDLNTVPDGDIVLRLRAQDSVGEVFEDRQEIHVNQMYITDPKPQPETSFLPSAYYPGNPAIAIKGTVAPANFRNYEIWVWYRDGSTVRSTRDNVQLTSGGTSKIRSGVLGTWNTAGLPGDRYTIELRIYLTDGGSPVSKKIDVIIDPLIHDGWPVYAKGVPDAGWGLALMDHTTIADVNGDGLPEVIMGYGPLVHVKSHDGQDLPGWPQSVVPDSPSYPEDCYSTQTSPAVGDIDGDGEPEIVAVNNYGYLFVWHGDGTRVAPWPRRGGADRVALADINGDGKDEIINQGVRIWALDAAGNQLWMANQPYSWVLSAPAIGDVNGDGLLEIATYTTDPYVENKWKIFLNDAQGNLAPGWPVEIPAPESYGDGVAPVLGDIDNDGCLEIIVCLGREIYAFDYHGNVLPGWPQSSPVSLNMPAVGDINGDGRPEVVVGTRITVENSRYVAYLYAFDGNGALLPGWPARWPDRYVDWSFWMDGLMAPAIADVDGDGINDVLVAGGIGEFWATGLNVFRYDGTEIRSLSRPTWGPSAWADNTAAIADMDGDGLVEVVFADYTGTFYMWDFPAEATATGMSWPMYMHDSQHTGAVPAAENRLTGTVVINGGETYARSASVLLALSATGPGGITLMQFSNDDVLWTAPEAYAPSKTWDLQDPDGAKRVFVKFGDAAGNWSSAVSAPIILDTTAPATTASPGGGTYTETRIVTLMATDATSGVDRIYYTTDGTTPTAASPVYSSPLTISSTKTVKYFAVDKAGNCEAAGTQTYTINRPGVIINGGTIYTRSTSVTLTLSPPDNFVATKMRFSDNGTTWGKAMNYTAAKTYSLPTGDGLKTVYVQFGNAAGNWSTPASDTIILDATAPVTTASPAGGNYSRTQSVTLRATDATSGVQQIYYTMDGTTPTTASPVYSSPLSISPPTTLKYFATDKAGNSEGVKTQTYRMKK